MQQVSIKNPISERGRGYVSLSLAVYVQNVSSFFVLYLYIANMSALAE